MSNGSADRQARNWPNGQNAFLGNTQEDSSTTENFIRGEVYGNYSNVQTISENYTVLPVGHGNFLKVYHSKESEPQTFSNYELFSSNSLISHNSPLPQSSGFENQFQNNDATNMIINQLVTNWSPNLSGTYSPFGEQHASSTKGFNSADMPENSQVPPTILQKNGINNFHPLSKTNGSLESSSSSGTEIKKRIVAEVKPMRMSYSDVLSKNVSIKSNSTNANAVHPTDLSNSNKTQKSTVEKGKATTQTSDKKSYDEKDKSDFKAKRQETQANCKNDETFPNQNNVQKDKKRVFVDELKDPGNNSTKNIKKSQVPLKGKQKNPQSNTINLKRRSKRDCEDDEKNHSKGNDKECFYNITKNEVSSDRYPKLSQHGNSKKKCAAGQKNVYRPEKQIYTKRGQKPPRDVKYELIAKFLEKWFEYTTKILIWLFYLIYDIVVLGFSMIVDRLLVCYANVYAFVTAMRQDLKNNSGKPNAWIKNIFKKFDSKFKKNSKYAIWRKFWKKKPQEPVADFYKNGRLPQTGDEAMYSLLNCKGKDAYSILGVSSDSSQEQIRKHYKKIAVLVHPDKNKQPGAEEAFKVLQRAFELIGEPENRHSYDQSLAEALNAEKAWSELHDLLSQLQSKIAEAANTIRCSSCGLRHPRKLTERPHYAARECSSCKISHSAREGDIWAETSIFGLRWKYYALMEGKVYDITEWANCQKGALSHLQPNSHIVQYRIVRGGQQQNQQQQTSQVEKDRTKREPTCEPSLDDFLDNLYSGQNPQGQQTTSRRRSKRN